MSIIFSSVSRGVTVLAAHAICAGNFDDVIEHILEKIPPEDGALTYSQGPYLFNYICENGTIYMCISDENLQRSRAFLFLIEIMERFEGTYGDGLTTVPHIINTQFSPVLVREMKRFNTSNDVTSLSKQIDKLNEIMSRKIDDMSMRGEHMNLLVNDMPAGGIFRSISQAERGRILWCNVAFYSLIAILHMFVAYLLISMICGGLAWKKCI